jgi:hypothetical protein
MVNILSALRLSPEQNKRLQRDLGHYLVDPNTAPMIDFTGCEYGTKIVMNRMYTRMVLQLIAEGVVVRFNEVNISQDQTNHVYHKCANYYDCNYHGNMGNMRFHNTHFETYSSDENLEIFRTNCIERFRGFPTSKHAAKEVDKFLPLVLRNTVLELGGFKTPRQIINESEAMETVDTVSTNVCNDCRRIQSISTLQSNI